jgi:hypothetical protein
MPCLTAKARRHVDKNRRGSLSEPQSCPSPELTVANQHALLADKHCIEAILDAHDKIAGKDIDAHACDGPPGFSLSHLNAKCRIVIGKRNLSRQSAQTDEKVWRRIAGFPERSQRRETEGRIPFGVDTGCQNFGRIADQYGPAVFVWTVPQAAVIVGARLCAAGLSSRFWLAVHLRGRAATVDILRVSMGSPWLAIRSSPKASEGWWPGTELNCRHYDFQSYALPTELPGHSVARNRVREFITISNITYGRDIERHPVARKSQDL